MAAPRWLPDRGMARCPLAALLAALLLLLSVPGLALADPLDDETRRIGKGLQCPVCQGASVADSPSDLATQMRGVIRRKLEQGESEAQIVAYFVERYGDGVLIAPPRRGIGLAAWIAPFGVLLGGLLVLGLVLRRWIDRRAAPVDVAPAFGPPAGRVRDELDRFRREA